MVKSIVKTRLVIHRYDYNEIDFVIQTFLVNDEDTIFDRIRWFIFIIVCILVENKRN